MRIKTRKTFILILAIIICLQLRLPVYAQTDDISEAKKGMIEVYAGVTIPNGEFYRVKKCDGFIISNSDTSAYIIANYADCDLSVTKIQKKLRKKKKSITDYSIAYRIVVKGDVLVEANVKTKSSDNNFVILETSGGLSDKSALKLAAMESVISGHNIYSLSFSDNSAEFLRDDVIISSGIIEDSSRKIGDHYYIQHNIGSLADQSGIPLIDEEGYVIGISDARVGEDGYSYALPMDEIRDILDNFNIKYSSKDEIYTLKTYKKLMKECQEAVQSDEYKKSSKAALEEELSNAYEISGDDYNYDEIKESTEKLTEAKKKLVLKTSSLILARNILGVAVIILAIWNIIMLIWKRRNKELIERYKNRKDNTIELDLPKKPIVNQPIGPIVPNGLEPGSRTIEVADYFNKDKLFEKRKRKAFLVPKGNALTVLIDKETWTIGKSEKNNYRIRTNGAVSREHAEIIWKDNKYYIRDLGSRNGTIVNYKILEPNEKWQLKNNDKIYFADELFVFKEES